MTYKPLIGLNCDFRAQVRSTPAFAYLGAGYYESIIKAGGVPVIIPPQIDSESITRITETLDGVVLVGGGDLDPRRDGFMLHPSVRLMDAGRETSDRMLMADVAERRMPLLAIGSGMQLMNVQQGGNLFLHIKEDLPNAVPHFDAQDTNHRHTLEIESDSLIGRVYGDGEIRVTSRHHMAVDEIAPGFRVTARCPDGVIEAIESEMLDWFAVGTQFHPESAAASALDIRIFEEFIEHIVDQKSAVTADEEAYRLVA
ncbi:MAG: gamma-glutamyl-gamma-aminobutyrate hydrolase family protein [Planctomycetota bacterium]